MNRMSIGCLLSLMLLCSVGMIGSGWSIYSYGSLPAPLTAYTDVLLPDDTLVHRIAIIENDGNVAVLLQDGSERVALTTDASAKRVYSYPTWSRDGKTVALVEVSQAEGEEAIQSAIHLIPAKGGKGQRVTTPYTPFYLFWNPTSEALAFLSNWPPSSSMALQMVDVEAEEEESTLISEGMPFFFSWEPAGEAMLAHIGGERLTFLNQSEESEWEREPLQISSGRFQAPHWSPDGRRLAFVSQGEDQKSILNVSDAQGDNLMAFAEEEATFALNWSPDNHRLAYSYTKRTMGLAAFGPLWVQHVTTGQAWEVSNKPVVAFFWNPSGQALAFLRPELHPPVKRAPEASPLRQDAQLWLRWHVWDGERTYPMSIFSPSEPFLGNYLRFFDQYAQSISLWSPDNSALLYAGLSENGVEGIWVLPVKRGSTPQRIASGKLGTWAPR